MRIRHATRRPRQADRRTARTDDIDCNDATPARLPSARGSIPARARLRVSRRGDLRRNDPRGGPRSGARGAGAGRAGQPLRRRSRGRRYGPRVDPGPVHGHRRDRRPEGARPPPRHGHHHARHPRAADVRDHGHAHAGALAPPAEDVRATSRTIGGSAGSSRCCGTRPSQSSAWAPSPRTWRAASGRSG